MELIEIAIMKNIILVVVMLVICQSSYAEKNIKSKPRQAIGISLGWVVANGLSYRRYFGSQFLQGTFAGAVNKDEEKEYIDISVSYGNYLNQFNLSNGNFPVGFKFISGIEVERDTDRRNDLVSTDESKSANELHLGAGFGIDFGNPGGKGILYSIDLIYTASFRGIEKKEFVRLGMLPSVSIQYNL